MVDWSCDSTSKQVALRSSRGMNELQAHLREECLCWLMYDKHIATRLCVI